jgi:hypothetical protein
MEENKIVSEQLPENISYVAYESAVARAEARYDKLLGHLKLVIVLWFATIILFGAATLWYLTLPVEETYENIKQDTNQGGNNIIGDNYNGETGSDAKDNP